MSQSMLITGGTGSLGNALVSRLQSYEDAARCQTRVVVLSRDEVKQTLMSEKFSEYDCLRFFLGDVRDVRRLRQAMEGVQIVIHAAALKRVDKLAYDPIETKLTNLDGTVNVLEAAVGAGVKKVLLISSDKACAPTNIYGASKMMAEHMTISYNSYSHPRGMACSVLRYGNVFNSRGSVMEYWTSILRWPAPNKILLPLTDPGMSRFVLTLDQAVDYVFNALCVMEGGEIFVPMLPSMQMVDLVEAFGCGYKTIGMRPGGEKLAETLITPEESARTYTCFEKPLYCILPSIHSWGPVRTNLLKGPPLNHEVVSNINTRWLTVPELRSLIESECGFEPQPQPSKVE